MDMRNWNIKEYNLMSKQLYELGATSIFLASGKPSMQPGIRS